jgi:hypothetical protein
LKDSLKILQILIYSLFIFVNSCSVNTVVDALPNICDGGGATDAASAAVAGAGAGADGAATCTATGTGTDAAADGTGTGAGADSTGTEAGTDGFGAGGNSRYFSGSCIVLSERIILPT